MRYQRIQKKVCKGASTRYLTVKRKGRDRHGHALLLRECVQLPPAGRTSQYGRASRHKVYIKATRHPLLPERSPVNAHRFSIFGSRRKYIISNFAVRSLRLRCTAQPRPQQDYCLSWNPQNEYLPYIDGQRHQRHSQSGERSPHKKRYYEKISPAVKPY